MSKHVIIVGGGRVGRHSAARLTENGYLVTVIERDAEKCANFPGHQASRVIEGDGTDVDTLRKANPATAVVVAGLTNDTATNLTVCEIAREVAPEAETYLRIAADGEEEYSHLGHVDGVIYPAALGATATVNRIVPS